MHMRHQVVVHCCIAFFTASRHRMLIYLLTKIAAAALLCPGVSPLLWLLPSALRSTFSPSLSSSGPVARPPFTTAVSMSCHASHVVVLCCLTSPLSVTDMACFSCVLVVFCVTAESLHFYNLSNDCFVLVNIICHCVVLLNTYLTCQYVQFPNPLSD
jgi:hypothetical protein